MEDRQQAQHRESCVELLLYASYIQMLTIVLITSVRSLVSCSLRAKKKAKGRDSSHFLTPESWVLVFQVLSIVTSEQI